VFIALSQKERNELMKRGTKEFYEVKAQFEKAVNAGVFGYTSSDLTEDDSCTHTFYANGEINKAFKFYMGGYAAAKCEYQ